MKIFPKSTFSGIGFGVLEKFKIVDPSLKRAKPFALIKKRKDRRVKRFRRKIHGSRRSRGDRLVTKTFSEAAVGVNSVIGQISVGSKVGSV